MSKLDFGGFEFNAEDIEPDSFDPIPAGEYVGMIIESSMKETKARTGHYLELRIQITEGDYANRIVFDRLNIDNPNDTAKQIAYRTLSSICRAIDVMMPKDSEELHDIPMRIKVAIQPATEQFGESNVVKGYKPYGAQPGAQPKPAVSENVTTSPGDKKMPWEK